MPAVHKLHSQERAVLVGVERPQTHSVHPPVPLEYSLEELENLAKSAGARVVEKFTQRLRRGNPATPGGRGKVGENPADIKHTPAEIIIFF